MSRPIVAVAVTVAVAAIALAIHNVLVAAGVGEVASVAGHVGLATGLGLTAVRAGIPPGELGLVPRRRGVMLAVSTAPLAVLVVATASRAGLVPLSAALAGLDAPARWFRLLVAIPVGTALAEEVIFRGVLLAVGDRVVGTRWSTLSVSAAFGLWHVAAETQRIGGLSPAVTVGVGATAAASALVLCPLRRRGGDLAAPVAVHAATNLAVFIAAAQVGGQ